MKKPPTKSGEFSLDSENDVYYPVRNGLDNKFWELMKQERF